MSLQTSIEDILNRKWSNKKKLQRIAIEVSLRSIPRSVTCGAWSKHETKCIRKKGHTGLHSDEERDRGV